MKKILFVAALLLTGATLVVAETIAEVYYNPSRLGSYEVLKVTDSLNMEGALETASMRINSSDAGQVTISASQKNNSYAFGANGITYGVDVQGRIDMNTAAFVKNSVLNVFLHDGGSAEFKGSGVTSTIGTLGKANDGWAGKLEAGSGGLQAATVNVRDVLTLGGVSIPVRSVSGLTWASRKDVKTGNTVQVLARNSAPTEMCSWELSSPADPEKRSDQACNTSAFSNNGGNCTKGNAAQTYIYCDDEVAVKQTWSCVCRK